MTSSSDPIRVDFLTDLAELLPGRLGLTIAPGKCNLGMQAIWQRQLEPDLQRLRQHYHTDLLITLLQAHELSELKIPALFDQVCAAGMQSRWFPIRDFGTPDSMPGLQQLVGQMLVALEAGQTIVVHCKGGLGRAGLVTASCLVALGYSPEAAFRIVRQARPGSVETLAQEAYVAEFAQLCLSAER
jgi:protein-tyrosine phosphatase